MSLSEQALSHHLAGCVECLLASTKQQRSLSGAGCPTFKKLLTQAYPRGLSPDSPLRSVHVTSEMVENHYFGRLQPLEERLFQTHVKVCSACAVKLHNDLLFIYSLKSAMQPKEFSPNTNRNGATFASVAAASV